MKKKTEAQIYLERLEMIDTLVKSKLIEQRQWKELAMSITANMDGERVQASGTKSKMADAVIKSIAMEEEVCAAVERLIAEKREIVSTLEKLNNPFGYKILHMRYIQYIRLSDIANKLNMDYSTITTTHGRALKSIGKIISEK